MTFPKLIRPPKFSRQNILFFVTGIILFVVFIIFTLLVREDLLRSFDFNTTVRLQDDIPVRFDDFFSLLSVVGRFEYTAAILLIFCILRGVKKKNIWPILPFFIFGFAHVIELIGKTILEQPGPPRMFLRTHFTDFPGLHIFTDASYPSGHSLRIVFLAIIFFWTIYKSRFPVVIKLGCYSFFITIMSLMLISRVSLGEHWTTDVIGGSFLGASMAFLSLIFLL